MAFVDVTVSGPLFDPERVRAVMSSFENDAAEEIASAVKDRVSRDFANRFKESHGKYLRDVTISRAPRGRKVDDDKSDYGDWLEGLSRRNKSTQFRGYGSWKATAKSLDGSGEITGIANRILSAHLGGLL